MQAGSPSTFSGRGVSRLRRLCLEKPGEYEQYDFIYLKNSVIILVLQKQLNIVGEQPMGKSKEKMKETW